MKQHNKNKHNKGNNNQNKQQTTTIEAIMMRNRQYQRVQAKISVKNDVLRHIDRSNGRFRKHANNE